MYKQIEKCNDYTTLTRIWLASVKATHHFLTDEDVEYYHHKLPVCYMPHVSLYAVRNGKNNICGFIGIAQGMIQMLFVHPDCMGKGYGSLLLRFAVETEGIGLVDVNEQNTRALEFYRRHGFVVVSRDPVDGEGKPYPILHMELKRK